MEQTGKKIKRIDEIIFCPSFFCQVAFDSPQSLNAIAASVTCPSGWSD